MKSEIYKFAKKCQKYFQFFEPVKIIFRPEDPSDIYCFPLKTPPEIVLAKKWHEAWKQNKDEAKKRIVHEFIHIVLHLPDNIDSLHYYSHPWKDAFSLTVYQDMQKHDTFDMNRVIKELHRNLSNPEFMNSLIKNGKLGWS